MTEDVDNRLASSVCRFIAYARQTNLRIFRNWFQKKQKKL